MDHRAVSQVFENLSQQWALKCISLWKGWARWRYLPCKGRNLSTDRDLAIPFPPREALLFLRDLAISWKQPPRKGNVIWSDVEQESPVVNAKQDMLFFSGKCCLIWGSCFSVWKLQINEDNISNLIHLYVIIIVILNCFLNWIYITYTVL